MRGKKAKQLRKVARETGLPEQTNYMQHKKAGYVAVGRCVRGVYKELKKAYKNGTLTEAGSSPTVS